MDDKSEKCVFVGYSERSKAYKLYNPITKKLMISRDVKFREEESWDWKEEKKNGEFVHVDLDEETDIPAVQNEEVTTPPTSPVSPSSNSISPSTSSSESPHLKTRRLSDIYRASMNFLEEDYAIFALFADADPINSEEASKEEKWKQAMDQEMEVKITMKGSLRKRMLRPPNFPRSCNDFSPHGYCAGLR